jgi:diaminopropionate ammonia-lyase
VVDGSYDEAVRRSAEEASERCLVINDTSWPGYEQVPQWVIDGYSTIFFEIDAELSERGEPEIDAIAVQIGVGAFASAAVRHYRRPGIGRAPAIIGVEPRSAACALESARAGRIVSVPGPHTSIMAGLNCDTPSLVAWPSLADGVDLFVAIEDDRTQQAMRELARAGVVAGESGAAGLGGVIDLLDVADSADLRRYAGLTPASTLLTVCTEGATDPVAYKEIVGVAAAG